MNIKNPEVGKNPNLENVETNVWFEVDLSNTEIPTGKAKID